MTFVNGTYYVTWRHGLHVKGSDPAGKVHLSPLVDCYGWMVVFRSIGTTPTAKLANSMLRNGIAVMKGIERLIVHSNRGCNYRWPEWIANHERSRIHNIHVTKRLFH